MDPTETIQIAVARADILLCAIRDSPATFVLAILIAVAIVYGIKHRW